MCVYIIPHPTPLLILAKEQKKILQELNTLFFDRHPDIQKKYGCLFLPSYPLWCKTDIQLQDTSLKELRAQISNCHIQAPLLYNQHIVYPVSYSVHEKQTTQYITVASYNHTITKKHDDIFQDFIKNTVSQLLTTYQDTFPLQCKIFQLAHISEKNHVLYLKESVWVKIK
ncbi:MAG: hypothetical protein K6E51_11035 [Treponema sp.]|nr:hypothetical protein [Treponema sp.]